MEQDPLGDRWETGTHGRINLSWGRATSSVVQKRKLEACGSRDVCRFLEKFCANSFYFLWEVSG